MKQLKYQLRKLQEQTDKPFVPFKHPFISGDYEVVGKFGNDYKIGDVVSSRDGWVHGCWSTIYHRRIHFFESKYFKPLHNDKKDDGDPRT